MVRQPPPFSVLKSSIEIHHIFVKEEIFLRDLAFQPQPFQCPATGNGCIELAAIKTAIPQKEFYLIKAQSLGFMNGDCPCQAQGDLHK